MHLRMMAMPVRGASGLIDKESPVKTPPGRASNQKSSHLASYVAGSKPTLSCQGSRLHRVSRFRPCPMCPFKEAGVIIESDRSLVPANDEPGLFEVVFREGVAIVAHANICSHRGQAARRRGESRMDQLRPTHTHLARFTVQEIADLLKLNQQTVRNWIDTGRLPAVRIGRRIRVRRVDLDRLQRTARPSRSSQSPRPSHPPKRSKNSPKH